MIFRLLDEPDGAARDFAELRDRGYRGLYAGETAQDIAARKGFAKGEKTLDWMGAEELEANLLRITHTEAKVARESIDNKADANRAHYEVGRKVRGYIADLGGTMPEELPAPAESVQQVRTKEWRRQVGAEQPGPFGPGDEGEGVE